MLRRSPTFTPLLFDEDRFQVALQSLKSNADRTLHEAALRALARPRPAPGTPLVEHSPRPSTSTAVRLSAVTACRPSFSTRARDSQCGFDGSHSSRSGVQGGERKAKPFRK
ncbi:hypothetical protein E2C01_098986 [Portunus trituberculatus]|uniref:Uncharacterized protein n=1 Tax=Portunus trituberculatus TaxID=210409 RepID=A0A5B7K4B5_PORTR|nr:hypothetical protein [Portunus trituberculatus]